MRVFFDTNVLISALVARGLCADLYETVALDHDLVIGAPVRDELLRILERKLRVPAVQLALVKAELGRFEQAPAPHTHAVVFEPDPADAIVLACAVAAETDVFVTGDKALLALGVIDALPIWSPRELWLELVGSRDISGRK